jgi:hypothetical protein
MQIKRVAISSGRMKQGHGSPLAVEQIDEKHVMSTNEPSSTKPLVNRQKAD